MIENFTTPSWKRYKNLFCCRTGKFSILRILQYEELKNKNLKGRVLDFGGGKNADYHTIASFDIYESVNIDGSMNPTWVTSVGEKLPCPKNHYDIALSLNTLEHVLDARFALEQLYQSLKDNGHLICTVPFLYPIHAYPEDYFRPTDRWWELTLHEIGFKNIKTIPLLWGPFSTGLVCSGIPGPLKTLRLHAALLIDLFYIYLGRKFKKQFIRELPFHALGFFIEAQK